MSSDLLSPWKGQQIYLTGHFDVPVVLEDMRPLSSDASAGYECRVRLHDGSLQEVVISAEEAAAILGMQPDEGKARTPVDAEKLRLLIESARLRLAYAHDPQFAVSLSGIRTLPHQIEAVYQVMLPQPRLRFLLADDPGAGKTIMAGLLVKELKLREKALFREFEVYRRSSQKRQRDFAWKQCGLASKRRGKSGTTRPSSPWRARSPRTSSRRTPSSSCGTTRRLRGCGRSKPCVTRIAKQWI